jgi:hypothetical protein
LFYFQYRCHITQLDLQAMLLRMRMLVLTRQVADLTLQLTLTVMQVAMAHQQMLTLVHMQLLEIVYNLISQDIHQFIRYPSI